MNYIKKLLVRIGLVSINHNGTISYPFHKSPYAINRHLFLHGPRIYRFRNLPGVIKWIPGRLLPVRWGFGVCGFEFGDRGGSVLDVRVALGEVPQGLVWDSHLRKYVYQYNGRRIVWYKDLRDFTRIMPVA